MSRHIDVHELMKCASRDDDRLNSGKEVIFGLSDNYVIFDSFLKSPASIPAQGLYIWNMIVQGSTGKQVIGVNNVIEQTIEMQAGPFVFPQIQDVPYLVNRNNGGGPVIPEVNGSVVLRQNNRSINASIAITLGGTVFYTWPDPQNGSPMLQLDRIPDSTGTGSITTVAAPPPDSTTTSTTTNPIEYGQYPNSLLLNTVFPPLVQISTLPWLNNPYTQLPNGRFTIQVREVGLQSISDVNGNRHNFEYDVEYRTDIGKSAATYQAKPLKEMNTYIFTQPITSLQGISLVFRNPDIPIVFEPDVYRNVAFQINDGFINFILPNHNFRVGDRIYIQDFVPWPGSGNLNEIMNRPEGFVVANYDDNIVPGPPFPAVSNPLEHGSLLQIPNRFTTDPAISTNLLTTPAIPATIPNPIPPPPVTIPPTPYNATVPYIAVVSIFVEKRRMRIPIRFRSVVPKITNRIVPV